MATTTNFGWETPDDTDLVKDGAAAIRTALGGVDTSFVDLKGGTTGQVLSKASGTDLDFSWVAQDDSNAIQNAIVDAKGDIISATAADTPARLAVGANDTVLTADSTTATGLKWATPTAAGKNWTLVNTGGTSLSGSSTVTVSGISGADELFIYLNNGSGNTAQSNLQIRLNADSGSNYNVAGAVAYCPTSYNTNVLDTYPTSGGSFTSPNSAWQVGQMSTNVASNFSFGMTISGCNSSGVKVMNHVCASSPGGGSNHVTTIGQGFYSGTSTISSVSLIISAGTFDAGSVFVYKTAQGNEMTKYVERIIDATTGKETIRPYTAGEIAAVEALQAEMAVAKAERDAEQAERDAARQAVLDKLGLTAEEIAALLG